MTPFEQVTSRHKWQPGALEMARVQAFGYPNSPGARIYRMLAAELAMPQHRHREARIGRYQPKVRK
jgi:hypothetical protein